MIIPSNTHGCWVPVVDQAPGALSRLSDVPAGSLALADGPVEFPPPDAIPSESDRTRAPGDSEEITLTLTVRGQRATAENVRDVLQRASLEVVAIEEESERTDDASVVERAMERDRKAEMRRPQPKSGAQRLSLPGGGVVGSPVEAAMERMRAQHDSARGDASTGRRGSW